MADRLNKSLDDIITDSEAQQRRGRGRGGGSSMAARGRQGQRRERKPEPYDTRRQPRGDRNERSADEAHTYECAIKYLLDNNKSGSFIGNGGASIKDMIEITGASIHISNPTRCHPLTGDRVVFITGSEESVGLAQALVWEMIGQQTDAENEGLKDLIWNPAAAKASPGQYDTVEVSCQVVIPAAAGGRVMGRNGSVFRSMASDCGVTAHISAVEDSELLQERIVTIEGTVGECMNFSAMLLAKLMEVADGCQYVYSGSAYPRQLTAGAGGDAGSVTGGRGRASNSSSSNRRAPREDSVGRPAGRNSVRETRPALELVTGGGRGGPETISATTTIELAVPNAYVGAILGVQGSKLAEINALSGATVRVSNKGEYVEGTTNRIVTIAGSPICAQTAHTLIVHKIRQEMLDKSD